MTFLEKLDVLISTENLNRRTFSNKSGIPYTTISNWYQRGYDKLTLAAFRNVCDYFNVTMDSMAYDDREIEYKTDLSSDPLPKDQLQLIHDFRLLDERGQASVMDTVRRELEYTHDEKKDFSEDSLIA